MNPNAGRRRGRAVAAEVQATLEQAGIDSEQRVSTGPGETRSIALGLKPDEWDGILSIGGDGTLFEVVNGLLSSREQVGVPVGIVPVGTGNSFVKDLGVADVSNALEPILAGATRRIDLGHCTSGTGSFYFANLLGAGFVSEVARRANQYKALGPLSYILGVVQEVISLGTTPTILEIDGKRLERELVFAEICNSRFTGGDMMMAPDASISDGLLDVIVASRMTRRRLLRLLPTIFSGRHVDAPEIEVFRGSSISLRSEQPLALTPDGEILGKTPIDVRVHPGHLEVFGR